MLGMTQNNYFTLVRPQCVVELKIKIFICLVIKAFLK